MHFLNDEQFASAVAQFLGPYYVMLALMNAVAALYLWQSRREGSGRGALALLGLSLLFVILAPMAASGNIASMPAMPDGFQQYVNQQTGPVIYSVGTTGLLVMFFVFRSFFVKPAVAWTLWNASLLGM